MYGARLAFCCVIAWLGSTACSHAAEPRALSANPTLSVIGRAADFILRDLTDQPVKLSDYRGKVVVLAFIFTSCKSVCPLISKQMQALQDELKKGALFGDKASMLSVTVDPEKDTAAALAKYAENFGADAKGWRFLREEPAKLKAVLAAYDEWTKLLPSEEVDHPARVYLVDRAGNIREVYSLAFFDEQQAFLDIQALLRE